MIRRGLIGAKARLPAEYQEVEWLQGVNNPVIRLNIYPMSALKVRCVFRAVGTSVATAWGSNGGNATTKRMFVQARPYDGASPVIAFAFGNSGYTLTDYPTTENALYDVTLENGKIAVNGSETTFAYNTFTATSAPIGLFYENGSATTAAKICSFQLWRYGTLYFDLVPCYRKSDSKPGMYNLVDGNVFYNVSYGEFTVGRDV